MNNVCSIELLSNAVTNRLTADEEAALYDHLERCESCCAHMEQLAGGEQWQQEAASLLTTDKLDAATPEPIDWSDVDFSVEHLEPSGDANVLGQLGGYDVLAIIGRGGMGVVLKAFDRELKRFVAIKALSPHLAHSSVARKRFAREAQAAAAVVNPHVIAIHHVQPTGRLPFLIMPLLTGESLAQRLKSRAPLELTEVLRIGMQAAVGLAAAHDQGLVHRDVKPANIFLEKGVERVVITDFGLARAADDVSMTRQGVLAGTPEYMSPEQARGEALDARSDLFSLGCVLYEMATGVSPFRADSTIATLRRIVDDKPAAIASLAPELPPWFSYIVERLLSKEPAQRFASASEVALLLEQCLSHLQQPTSVSLPASLVSHATRSRSIFNSNRSGIWIMLGTLGMAFLGMVLWQATDPPDISGQWTSDEWGTVTLEAKEPGQYQGTFTVTDGDVPSEKNSNAPAGSDNQSAPIETQSGVIQLKWSRLERRFNGTWRRGASLRGKISLRLIDDDIRGAWTTNKDVQKDSDIPRLADLLWSRNRETIDATKINSNEWEMKQVFNPAHDQMVWAVAFTSDGKTIASAGADKRIKFWDVASGLRRSTSSRPVNCTDIAYSPNGMYLAIAGGDHGENPPGELVLLETANGKEEFVVGEEFVLESHESAKYSKSVAFSPDSKWLASGGSDKAVKIWNVEQRELQAISTGHTKLVSQVAFSPNGKTLASASFDNTVKLWSVPDGDAIATLRGHEKEVRGIAFSPDGKLLVSVGEDGTARVWDTSSGEQLGVMNGHGERFFSVAFSPDGQHVATGSRGPSGVLIWDVNTLKSTSPVVLPQQDKEIMSLKFSSDGQMLAIVGSWNGFQIWNRKAVGKLSGSEKSSVRHESGPNVDTGNKAIRPDITASEAGRSNLPKIKESEAHIAATEKEFHQLELAEEDLRAAYGNAIENAKSDEDRERAEKQFDARDAYTPKYLTFEEKYRGTPAGLKALLKVVGFARSTIDPNSPAPAGRVEAVDRLIDHYVAFDGIEQAFDHLRGGLPVPREKVLLKAVVEKNPSRHVQAEALIAQLEWIRVSLLRHANLPALRERVLHPEDHHPELWRESNKAVLRELESTTTDQLRAEMKSIIEQLKNEYSLVPVAKYGTAHDAAKHLSHSITKIVIGKHAPEIKAITSTGKLFQLSKLRGSNVLLVFGLNHGSDNKVMYAPLRKLAADYKGKQFEVVMILNSREDEFQSASTLKRDLPWTVIQQPNFGPLSLDWGVRGFPAVYFIDSKGILQSWITGMPCYDDESGYDTAEVSAELNRLLNSKPKDADQTSQRPAASDVNNKPLGVAPETDEHPKNSTAGHKSCPFCEIESKSIRQEIQANEAWSRELPGSDELDAYVAAIRTLPDSPTERFKFFWNHLEHANETIAEDSSKEVAFVMHEYWNTSERRFDFKPLVDLQKLRSWLKDAHVPEHRRRVYLRLLGVVGDLEDTEVLKRTIDNGVRENPNSNLQAQIEAYVLLGGPEAWDFVEHEILDSRDVPDTSVYAMISAIRFFDTHSCPVAREQLLQSLHLMLERPSLSDIVVKELIRMEDWSQVEKLVNLLKSSDEGSKWVRTPIIEYLQSCPLPEAAEELKKLREISKAVERALQQIRKPPNKSEARALDGEPAVDNKQNNQMQTELLNRQIPDYADLQGDWIVDSFYFDEDANSRELQKQAGNSVFWGAIKVEANEFFFRNPPVAGMSRISGAISLKPVEGNDPRLFQVVDSRISGGEIKFGMYKVVGDKLTILLTRDAPPKLLAPTEGELYFECHRPASEEDRALLDLIDKNPDQINVIDLILKDSKQSPPAKEDTTATDNASATEKPSVSR